MIFGLGGINSTRPLATGSNAVTNVADDGDRMLLIVANLVAGVATVTLRSVLLAANGTQLATVCCGALATAAGARRRRPRHALGNDRIIADFSHAQGDRLVLAGPGDIGGLGTDTLSFGATTITVANGHLWGAADLLIA